MTTTTELIKLLQDNEKGGISHRSRQISLTVNGRYMPDPQITLSSTGDGIAGPEIDLDVYGEWLEHKADEIDEVLDKIRTEIEEYKSRQLTLAIGVEDLEKGKQTALEYVLAIIDKYRAEGGDKE